jgi:5'-phosphate synthase pdxT subunit
MVSKRPVIGVLALQGCVQPHQPHIEAAGGIFLPVKTEADFNKVDAFILPGGESTTMLKLIHNFNLKDILLREFHTKPVWGICAGAILMASKVLDPAQDSFKLIDITLRRNGYGRQLDSTQRMLDGYPVSFIRAPVIEYVQEQSIDVLAEQKGQPIWLKKGHYMMSTFHPELTPDYPSPMHQRFMQIVNTHYSH